MNLNFQPEWILICCGIVGICEGLKSFDKKRKLARFYGILPLFFGFVAGLYLGFTTIPQFIGQSLVFGGLSILIYQVIIKNVKMLFGKNTPGNAGGKDEVNMEGR